MPGSTTWRRTMSAASGLIAAVAACGMAGATPAHAANQRGVHVSAEMTALAAHTVLRGADHGWSSPDDLTSMGSDLYVSFQNGVPSSGGSTGTPTKSTIVKFTLEGTVERTWQLSGKCDGLTADPAHDRVIATVNEDGNSSLYTLPSEGRSAPKHYTYDATPLPHGGGTDAITIYRGGIYVVASAPVAGGPALYRITLRDGVAHLAAAPFYDTSSATVANTGAHHATVNLSLTDPDSSTVVPQVSPRFAGDFMLDAQGEQQAIFASRLGTDDQHVSVLNLSQSVDDTAFATSRHGALVTTDSTAKSVVVITGTFTRGTAYTAVTPGNANNARPHPAPNYLGRINLNTGTISPATTAGQAFTPHALLFISHTD